MFIIRGRWRQMIKNIWPVHKLLCSHCHNENFFFLQRISVWFTLFFIPIFPYKWYHFLYCPTCNYWFKLSYDEAAKMIPLAELNSDLVDGRITHQEYQDWLKHLSGEDEKANEEIPRSITNNKEFKSCPLCWKEVKKIAKKCKHCKEWIE